MIISDLIAHCGMNCALCAAYQREKNKCPGCKVAGERPKSRVVCLMKNCPKRRGEYCFECPEFPCPKLKQMDKRYREKYRMSEIENLEKIREKGIKAFWESEEKKWKCPTCNNLICAHKHKCLHCGSKNND